jgi:hypothetical protein
MPSLKIHTCLVGLAILYIVFSILIARWGVGLARLFNCTNAGLDTGIGRCHYPDGLRLGLVTWGF